MEKLLAKQSSILPWYESLKSYDSLASVRFKSEFILLSFFA